MIPKSRRVSVFSILVLFSVFAVRALAQSPDAGRTAGQQFKNIKVLKDVPVEQFIPAMQFISASLGVECQFCHVQDAFEKDDKKPKQTARKMMEMMFAIDKDNFEGHRAVTCNSCHRGSLHPAAIPAVMGAIAGNESPAPVAVTAHGAAPLPKDEAEEAKKEADDPSADALMEKYVKAVGGSTAIDKIASRAMKGTITFGDRNVPIDIYAKDPDKRISYTHTPDGDSVTAFDGHQGWLGFPGRPPREMHGPDIDGASIDADLHFASHLKSMFSKAEVHGTENIEGHEAYRVVGDRSDKPPLELYFDEQSGLLLRLVRFAETPLGLLPTQIDYADYRDAGGVKIPFRWTLARPSGRFTIQATEVKVNVPVDDAQFARPAMPDNPGPPK
jgi:hypothetical protein